MATNKTATVNVPIQVRKTGPDEYQYQFTDGSWSASRPEYEWRFVFDYFGASAIVQAIESGAFADPLPTAVNSTIYIKAVDSVFALTGDEDDTPWCSTRWLGTRWHSAEQVQSYGEFEVLYDPDNPTKKES